MRTVVVIILLLLFIVSWMYFIGAFDKQPEVIENERKRTKVQD